MGIIADSEFEVHFIVHTLKVYTKGQLVFGRDMVLPIKHIANWKLIRQSKQAQINYDNVRKNKNRLDHDYQVRYRSMIRNNVSYKYQSPI